MTETTMTTQRADDLPERWSAARKMEIVLRLVRGEAIDEVAREVQVPVHEVEDWRRVFLESGQHGLKRRGLDPEERELRRLQAKIGDMTMRLSRRRTCSKKGGSRRTCGGCGNEPAAQSDRGQTVSAADGVRRVAGAAFVSVRPDDRARDDSDEARAEDGPE